MHCHNKARSNNCIYLLIIGIINLNYVNEYPLSGDSRIDMKRITVTN